MRIKRDETLILFLKKSINFNAFDDVFVKK